MELSIATDKMRFRQYTPDLYNIDKIIIDGNKCGIGIQLSHWPGNATPKQFKADLSVEIVLRLLKSPGALTNLSGIDLVTNDHYDTDGLLATWALLHPLEALQHTSALVAAAEAGDFYEFASPTGVQCDLLIRAFESTEKSPLRFGKDEPKEHRWQIATEAVMGEMPDLLYEPERYRPLWEEDYRKLLEKISLLKRGFVEVREWPIEQLSVISTKFPLNHFTRNIACRGHRILETSEGSEGATYELHYREFLWYDIVSRPRTPKHLLIRAAEQLNDLESPGTCGWWGVTKWTPALRFVASGPRAALNVKYNEPLGYSSLPIETVERVIRRELRMLDRQISPYRT
jgi:hypothetical protein